MAGNLQNAAGIAAAPFRTSRDTEDSKLYRPKDWQYADGDVWVVTGQTDTTKWENLWQSDKATLCYDTAVKAEGAASLKATYAAGTIGVGPVYGKNSVINQFGAFSYLTVRLKNPDPREKTVKLQFTYGNQAYTAVPVGQTALQTRITLAANSDFTAYTFDLTQLVDARGNMATDATRSGVLNSASKMEFVVTDTADGTIYLDDIQFGLDEPVLSPEVDITGLQDAVEQAETVEPEAYTAETAGAFARALQTARDLLADTTVSQGAVDAAAAALRQAQASLIPLQAAGDVNGDNQVDIIDALMALQAASGRITLSPAQKLAANVDGQGTVTTFDALLILKLATHQMDSFQ